MSSKNVFRPLAVNPEGKTLGFLGRVCDWGKKKLREAKESLDKNVGFTSSSSKTTTDFKGGIDLELVAGTYKEATTEIIKTNGKKREKLNADAYANRNFNYPSRRLLDSLNLSAGLDINIGPVNIKGGIDGIGFSGEIGAKIKDNTHSAFLSLDLNENITAAYIKTKVNSKGEAISDIYSLDVNAILTVVVAVVAVAACFGIDLGQAGQYAH